MGYQFMSGVGDVEIIGPGKTRPVVRVTAQADESGYVFTTVVARVDYQQPNLGMILNTIAEAIDKDAKVPGVENINLYQDVNQQGQFVNKVEVGITSTSGASDNTIEIPYGAIFDARFAARVGAARDHLDAVEAG
jgi:hypothetical protein